MDFDEINAILAPVTRDPEELARGQRWVSWDEWRWLQSDKFLDDIARKLRLPIKNENQRQRQLENYLRYKSLSNQEEDTVDV